MRAIELAELLGIARRSAKRSPMERLDRVEISIEAGVAGDSRGRAGPRQVTVLTEPCWQAACTQLASRLPWTTRRANLFVSGPDLRATTGRVLRIGQEVRLEITGELTPCGRMDEAQPGLRAALLPQWRGGVTCRVLSGGPVGVGDVVELI